MTSLESAGRIAGWHMGEIVKLFKPGVKIALIVRRPDHPDQDFMMTDDTLDEIKSLIERRAAGDK